jgi:hypothetical protein
MRTIKFKGLRVDGKGWVYGMPTFYKTYILNDNKVDSLNSYEVIPESVGQFTGKLTSNQVEIYEGDLIKTSVGVIPKEVNWNEKECSWYFGIKPLANLQFLDKIIGNINDK